MEVKDLFVAHDVIEELMNTTERASYKQNYQIVINAINAKIVELIKEEQNGTIH